MLEKTAYKSVMYAATVTLKSKMYMLKPSIQYDETFYELYKICKSLNSTVTIVAEYTKNYNIHYHLMIQFHTKSKDHALDFHNAFRGHKRFGFVNINQITDEPGWIQYMTKDLDKIIDRKSICADEFKVLPDFWEQYLSRDTSNDIDDQFNLCKDIYDPAFT